MPHSESNESRSRSRSASSERSRKVEEKKRESEGSSDNTCLYIGNIDKKLSQEKLNSAFAEFGELEYCYIVYEPYSASDRSSRSEPKQSRGYGFAKYKNPDDAIKARSKLQGADLNGRRITVEVSKRSKPRDQTPGRYLGKKRQSPVHKSHRRRSYSRSSSRSRSKSNRKSRRYHDKDRSHDKKRRHQRSRSDSYRRRRSSYSKSPRR